MQIFAVTGKKAIVTGGSRGLGLGIAEGFLEAGMEVALIGASSMVLETSKRLEDKGFLCHGIRADLADPTQREAAFHDAINRLGGLDVLVNAAGIQIRHKCDVFPIKDFERVISVNLVSMFAMCQLAGRIMLKQGHGNIINMASMLSYFGGYTVAAYAASKGGVAQITKALANEWAEKGVHVNALAPGYMATEMNEALLQDETRNTEILARIPAHRWGTAEDMVGPALFLASDASNYLHGAVIPVDGGYLGR